MNTEASSRPGSVGVVKEVARDVLCHHGNTEDDDHRIHANRSAWNAIASIQATHRDQVHAQRQDLTALDHDVAGQQLSQHTFFRDAVLEDLGGESGAVDEAKDKSRRFGVGLVPKPGREVAEVVECLGDDREPDDIGVDALTEHTPASMVIECPTTTRLT